MNFLKISKVGTHPIIGTQINLNIIDTIGKVSLYATSEEGFKNLTKLSSSSYLKNNATTDPSCSLKDLLDNNKGLILLTGNYTNFFGKLFFKNKLKDIEQILKSLKDIFKDRLYVEIQRHNEFQEKNFENFLLNISKSLQIPLIATQEIFYLNEEMYEAHDALTCIGEKTFVDDKNRFRYNNHHYFKSQDELKKLYSDIPEALENIIIFI